MLAPPTQTTENAEQLSAATSEGPTALPSITGNSSQARLAAFEKQEQAEQNAQQRHDHIQRLMAYMSQQSTTLLSGWGTVSQQQFQKAPPEKKAAENESAGSIASGSSGANGKLGAEPATQDEKILRISLCHAWSTFGDLII